MIKNIEYIPLSHKGVNIETLDIGIPLLYSNHGNKEYCIFLGLQDSAILVKFGRNEGILLVNKKELFIINIK